MLIEPIQYTQYVRTIPRFKKVTNKLLKFMKLIGLLQLSYILYFDSY